MSDILLIGLCSIIILLFYIFGIVVYKAMAQSKTYVEWALGSAYLAMSIGMVSVIIWLFKCVNQNH